jgi:ATP-dependent RNA circularization protein (DNA/RNA ligase family)
VPHDHSEIQLWFQKIFFKAQTSHFWECVKFHKIDDTVSRFCGENDRNLAIQGELIGSKIQNNPYQINGYDYYVFDIYDIDAKSYLKPLERVEIVKQLGLKHVPYTIENVEFTDINALLNKAEFKSKLNPKTEAEGHVYKSMTTNRSFKVISNKFLLKKSD